MFKFAKQPKTLSNAMHWLPLGLAIMLVVEIAVAKPDDITKAEMSLLPRYCPDTMGFKYGDAYSNTSPRAGYWVSLMGQSFWAMHHYCWGLIAVNRAQRSGVSVQARRSLWESARGDYGYVVKQSPPDFIMLPEIYTRIGEVELLLSRPDKANEAFAHARQLKPDYWPAYSHWAEFLMKIGKRPEALKIVTSGLENSPDAKVLLEQYRILGGKLSDLPKPVPKPLPENTSDTTAVPPESGQSPASHKTNDEVK